MKKLLLSFLLVCCSLSATAQLTEQSRISLITCDPGELVYERFGHTALRICDSTQHIDLIFHYGVFDFDTEFFIPKFIKGATDYAIGLCGTNYFIDNYAQRGSAVNEQVLTLTLPQRQQLLDALVENYRPENRLYRYNFVFDNCATRPYHMLLHVIDAPLLCTYSTDATYRDIIHECIGWHNWTAFGIALILGAEADQSAGNDGAIGFPFCLRDELDATWLQTAPDTIVPLVAARHTLVDNPPIPIENTPWPFSPTAIFAVLLIAGALLTWYDLKRHRTSLWFDVPLFGIVGIAGIVIGYLMFFSMHPLVHANWNLLWANPLWLVFAIIAPLRRGVSAKRHIAGCMALLTGIGLIMQWCVPQTFHPANLFIIVLLLLRLIPYLLRHKTNLKNN
ncbi:MAG: DUF4105 domain-containing protein [Paludibacteraceae bacterium]